MNSRERILCAINHRQPDRQPLDLGSNYTTSLVVEAYEEFKKHLGLQTPTELLDQMQRAVEVEEEVLREFDIDVRGINYGNPEDIPQDDLGPEAYRDAWGIVRVRPPSSFYYDQIVFPLAGEITAWDILNYPHPDPEHPGWTRHLRSRLAWIKKNTDCAILLQVPSPVVHISQYLRGFEDWYLDFVSNPRLLEILFDYCLDVNMAVCRNILREIGSEVDIVGTGDDLGAQLGLQISPEHYRKYIHPRLKRYFNLIHDLSPAKLFFHSCGSVETILGDLIDIGVDIINPVQVNAKGMDPVNLKEKFGKNLVFWGGIDSSKILPFGTVRDVKDEVERRMEQLGEGGGYVLCAVHNIQPDVSKEKIMAMYKHAIEYRPSYMK